jgi:hypothetical protein
LLQVLQAACLQAAAALLPHLQQHRHAAAAAAAAALLLLYCQLPLPVSLAAAAVTSADDLLLHPYHLQLQLAQQPHQLLLLLQMVLLCC